MLTFLQLSDIHFRNRLPGESDDDFRSLNGPQVLDYTQRELLIEDARSVGEQVGGFSAVLVAGDIASTGDRKQFSQASVWLRTLCTTIGVQPWMVWTIPGNHDVDDDRIGELERQLRERLRTSDESVLDALLDAIRADGEEGPALLRPLENYIEFADPFECAFDPAQLHWTSDIEFSDAYPLQLRGLSSALLCAKGDERESRRTMIGGCQAGDWAEGKIHFSMCHHPRNYLLDREELDGVFGENVQVRVTGHLHKRNLERTDIGIYLQAGAVSPIRGEDGSYHPGYEPTYDVITLKKVGQADGPSLEVAVHQRIWDDNEKRWQAGEEKICSFPLSRTAPAESLSQRPVGSAQQLEIPMREVRYKLAQLSLTDKYECLEQLDAPVADFVDAEDFNLVSSIFRWAEDNGKLDELSAAVKERSPK